MSTGSHYENQSENRVENWVRIREPPNIGMHTFQQWKNIKQFKNEFHIANNIQILECIIILHTFNLHLNNELAIFKSIFLLVKNVDPMGFHILQQLVAFGVEEINQLLRFCKFFGLWEKKEYNICRILSNKCTRRKFNSVVTTRLILCAKN
jgi:hypothetical protein